MFAVNVADGIEAEYELSESMVFLCAESCS